MKSSCYGAASSMEMLTGADKGMRTPRRIQTRIVPLVRSSPHSVTHEVGIVVEGRGAQGLTIMGFCRGSWASGR
jgi:hypothetical protein